MILVIKFQPSLFIYTMGWTGLAKNQWENDLEIFYIMKYDICMLACHQTQWFWARYCAFLPKLPYCKDYGSPYYFPGLRPFFILTSHTHKKTGRGEDDSLWHFTIVPISFHQPERLSYQWGHWRQLWPAISCQSAGPATWSLQLRGEIPVCFPKSKSRVKRKLGGSTKF